MKIQFTLRPVHYWIGLLTTLLVAGSVYFFSEGFRFEDEDEDEESEEKIVLQSMDLWTSMRAYPNAQIEHHFTLPVLLFRALGYGKLAQYTEGLPQVSAAMQRGGMDSLFQSMA